MQEPIFISGSTVCPACQMSGHDGDSCRANQLSDGRILCINCGSYIEPIGASAMAVYQMPFPVKCLTAALMRESELHVPALKLTMAAFGPDGSSTQASAACAQGTEGVILNAGRLAFSHGLSSLEIRFQADELQDLPRAFGQKARELSEDEQQFLHNLRLHSCPKALESAIGKLFSLGFTMRHIDFSGASMRRIALHCGGNIAGTKVPKGIMVEATYRV